METWKLLALVALLLAVVYCARGASESGGADYLAADTWQLESPEENFGDQVAELLKRSKPQQFYGLMGRRSGVELPARQGRKRNKGEMFVGLMGRRSSSGEFQEEWDKPQFY